MLRHNISYESSATKFKQHCLPATMITKFAVLFFAGACLAFPADDEQRPPSPQDIQQPQDIQPPQELAPNQAIPVPLPAGFQPEGQIQDGPVPPQGLAGGKPENSDLKTDNTFWYRRSYYPVYHRRSYSYYSPRSYTYSYYTPYYSYWNPYSWW